MQCGKSNFKLRICRRLGVRRNCCKFTHTREHYESMSSISALELGAREAFVDPAYASSVSAVVETGVMYQMALAYLSRASWLFAIAVLALPTLTACESSGSKSTVTPGLADADWIELSSPM